MEKETKSTLIITAILYWFLFQSPLPIRLLSILVFGFFLLVAILCLWRIGGFEFMWVASSQFFGAIFDLIAIPVKFAFGIN